MFFVKWFSEDVGQLFASVNRIYLDSTIADVLPEVVILKQNMLGPMRKLRTFGHFDAAVIIFPHSTKEVGLVVLEREDVMSFDLLWFL